LESLKSEALKLSEASRAQLAAFLLESLEPPVESRSEQWWLEEAVRRDEELASGAVEGLPWDDVLARARARARLR
jgi:putative addiction module component (TIGR02574 family)